MCVFFSENRITGLDPANPPYFPAFKNFALGKTDAQFVDIIHTDGGLYGAPLATGHVDFWPNGGVTLQPGCPTRNFVPLSDNGMCLMIKYLDTLIGG